MKAIFSFVLVFAVLVSCFAFAGCGKKSGDLYGDLEDFDSYVA